MTRSIKQLLFCAAVCLCQTASRTDLSAAPLTSGGSPTPSPSPKAITIRPNASALESLAANEIRRYAYLRSGKVIPVRRGSHRGQRVVVTRQDKEFCGDLGRQLGPQQFTISTETAGGQRVWWIVGGDELGVLYGAYRFAEKLGVRFCLDGDVVPDEPLTTGWPEVNETGKPRFELRGLQPFHDFSVGPDWWNADDYESVVSQMAKLRMNFMGLHTYPSWNPATGPEANVWIGLPEDVDPRGNVRFGYEAGVVTTRRGWAVTPYPTSQYASGAGLLFQDDDYGPDYLRDCLNWPQPPQAASAMFNRYGDFQQRVFGHARQLGIKICLGTELPLGVPPALRDRLASQGMKADDPDVIRRLYEGTFLRLMRKVPIDYYWLWTPEVWLGMEPGCKNWEVTSRANVERDLGLAQSAAQSIKAPFGLATSGWRLGTREDPLWLDKRTPKSWAASSIATGLGREPVEAAYATMTGRPRWAIGWAEDDDSAGAHCCTCWDLQLWVARMFENSAQASQLGCEGMMAIHWRTAAVSPNLEALALAGWNFAGAGGASAAGQALPGKSPALDGYWADWGRSLFGEPTGAEVGRIVAKLDGCHLGINALIRGGTNTTDARIADFFAPIRDLEALRPRLQGPGNLDRFDYWLNLIRASQLRVQTWVLAERLAGKMREVNSLTEPEQKRDWAQKQVLPLRLAVARSYEDMMAAYVNGARSPGEIGTIASIESGSRARIVTAHDSTLAGLLGEPLPAEAMVGTAYRGRPRIFVSAKRTQVSTQEPLEIRAFVLAASKSASVSLYWRPMGKGRFKKTLAIHQARQAFHASLPAQSEGTVEYYLEAVLEDGSKASWPAGAPKRCQTVIAW